MATQKSMNKAVSGGSFGQYGASTEPLGDWFPFEEFREHQPQLLHEVLGVTGRQSDSGRGHEIKVIQQPFHLPQVS